MGIFNRKNDDTAKSDKDGKAVKEKSSKKETTGKSSQVKKSSSKRVVSGDSCKILVRPLITEKAATMSTDGKYIFEVSVNANKIQIAKAVSEVYGVEPASVNVINMSGKVVRRGRMEGKRKDWRKAIVTLPKGKTIDIYEGI